MKEETLQLFALLFTAGSIGDVHFNTMTMTADVVFLFDKEWAWPLQCALSNQVLRNYHVIVILTFMTSKSFPCDLVLVARSPKRYSE